MRGVVQRVSRASVTVDGRVTGSIEKGLMVLLGIEDSDGEQDLAYMCDKLMNLRIFEDENEKMNLSVTDVGGSLLIISQFTLYGDARKGRRPSFIQAARAEHAVPMYESLVKMCRDKGMRTETGEFGAHMDVELCNDGPVTILLDSKKLF